MTDQLQRYRDNLPNLILTNYLEFRWYVDGARQQDARLAEWDAHAKRLRRTPNGANELHALLQNFLAHTPTPIADADALARQMARYAHLIRDAIIAAFQQNLASDLLCDLRTTFAETLLPDLDQPEKLADFADMLAQTLVYGLFAARCYHTAETPFTRAAAAHEIPLTNPFLRGLFDTLTGAELDHEPFMPFVDDLVELLAQANMMHILNTFGARAQREDPVVHFYETFLKEYDPKQRERRGVYYTPDPIVGYLTRAVHALLQRRFRLPDGLASLAGDSPLYLLDPACGTGSFLAHIVAFIQQELQRAHKGGLWNAETIQQLTRRLFGFELLMAPYTIAHLKLGLMLYPPSAPMPKPPPRLGVYLTNTMELPDEQIPMQIGPWRIFSQEAADAVTVKRETPLLVIIGNPPYSANSANKIEWIEALIRKDYYPRDHIKEQNPKLLLDDYVKFIRWAQWRLERTGGGILAFVTNHGYLENPTFRRMRRALMEAFDELYLLNLHGNAREGETAPDGSPDENVFDIQQGVALLIAVRNFPNAHRADKMGVHNDTIADGGDTTGAGTSARVWYYDLWGTREEKYAFLNTHTLESTPWQALQPQPPFYLFAPQDDALRHEYEQGWRLTDIFRLHSTGIKTHRDHFALDFERQTLQERIEAFRDLTIPDDEIRQRHALEDTRDWKLRESRQKLAQDSNWQAHFHPCLYRPFDVRWIYYSPTVIELPRDEVMRHMVGGKNLALISVRQHTQAGEWALVGVSDKLTECCAISNKTGEINYVFPLYLLTQDGREPNLHEKFLQALRAVMDREPTPKEVLAYIYAVLHAPSYRQRYAPFLRYDYPRVPLPASAEQFVRLASLGQHLIELHLLRCLSLRESPVGFPVSGSNRVEKGYPRYRDGAVWINDSQRFTGVSQAVWAMRVGGYQVCEKWLKDRRGRALSNREIETYRRLVYALAQTLELVEVMERVW
jgi:predicted helicase